MKNAVDTYREFWKQWIAESYGQETADKAKFDLNEHKWIESAMKAYAEQCLREAAEKVFKDDSGSGHLKRLIESLIKDLK